jgi:hypothetical protein
MDDVIGVLKFLSRDLSTSSKILDVAKTTILCQTSSSSRSVPSKNDLKATDEMQNKRGIQNPNGGKNTRKKRKTKQK